MSKIPTQPNKYGKFPRAPVHYGDTLECTVCHAEHKAACSQEVANRLVQDAGIDFRTAHRFASALVTEVRNAGWTPATVTREAVGSVWQAFRTSLPGPLQAEMPEAFPFSGESWLKATDPRAILEARATAGSASPARVARRLEEVEGEIGEAGAKLQSLIRRREEADRRLDAAARRFLED